MKKSRKAVFLFVFLLFSLSSYAELTKQENEFINQLVSKDHFNRSYLVALFQGLESNPHVIARMNTPLEKNTWDAYHSFFIKPERVQLGVAYWKTHHRLLREVEKKYGVPAEIMVAIIGVESEYGLHKGNDPVLNTLYTLSFYYKKQSTFFKSELRSFLLLARENHLPVTELKGSYAGAVGIPQFMPSSYRHYGISKTHHAKVDLFDNHNDAIASIGHYLAANGWQASAPIASPYLAKNKQLGKSRVVKFSAKQAPNKWVLYHNFDVIMRYNHSKNYAMVVYQLGQAIMEARALASAKGTPHVVARVS